MFFARFNIHRASGGPAPRVGSKDRNCTLLWPETSYNRWYSAANLAPVKTEARNKTDPINVLLAEASKTKRTQLMAQSLKDIQIFRSQMCL